MSDRIHRKIAVWFSMINHYEARESMRLESMRGNTSQRGTFDNFRNEKLNGKAIEVRVEGRLSRCMCCLILLLLLVFSRVFVDMWCHMDIISIDRSIMGCCMYVDYGPLL
jgi:hypothetical protein